jgi:hypothetical protein
LAAKELDTLRNAWLNPPEWPRTEILEFPGSTTGPWRRYIDSSSVSPLPLGDGLGEGASNTERGTTTPNDPRQSRGLSAGPIRGDTPETTSAPGSAGGSSPLATVRYPRIVPKDEVCAAHLKKRTLTNLYNERPTWLDLAHQKLDAAVFAAYGWDSAMTDDELLAALLALNLDRAAAH